MVKTITHNCDLVHTAILQDTAVRFRLDGLRFLFNTQDVHQWLGLSYDGQDQWSTKLDIEQLIPEGSTEQSILSDLANVFHLIPRMLDPVDGRPSTFVVKYGLMFKQHYEYPHLYCLDDAYLCSRHLFEKGKKWRVKKPHKWRTVEKEKVVQMFYWFTRDHPDMVSQELVQIQHKPEDFYTYLPSQFFKYYCSWIHPRIATLVFGDTL